MVKFNKKGNKMQKATLNLKNIIINKLATMDEVNFAYLFGSYSKNEQTAKSDIDIALYLKDISLDVQLQINYELSKLLKKDVDIVILNSVKNIFLLESILKDAIVLKESEKRFDFELLKGHEILDFKAFRRYIDAA